MRPSRSLGNLIRKTLPHVPRSTICSSPHAKSDAELVRILQRNPELDLSSAKDELRWIKQDIEGRTVDIVDLCERRSQGEPLQYILGTTDFGPLILQTRPPTLIPRPETAHITSLLAARIQKSRPPTHEGTSPTFTLKIADICTGSGCIALLLSHHLGGYAGSITGYDISTQAIALAKDNAKFVKADETVDFKLGDIWRDGMISGKVDILVSNPPYIPLSEWRGLPDSVKAHEDPRALIGDPSDLPGNVDGTGSEGRGLAFYRRIAEMLPEVLEAEQVVAQRGWKGMPRVAVEVGIGQAGEVQGIFENVRGDMIGRTEVWDDQFGVERMVVGYGSV